jgi:hypothetical protein
VKRNVAAAFLVILAFVSLFRQLLTGGYQFARIGKEMMIGIDALEKWMNWVARSRELVSDRNQAWRYFFGLDDPQAIDYMGDAGNLPSREMRFLGWYALNHTLADGRLPVDLAIEALVLAPKRCETCEWVHRSRYLLGAVGEIHKGQVFILQSGRERLAVLAPALSAQIETGEALLVHLIPNGAGNWVAGPGWVRWPMKLSPSMRHKLRGFHLHPIQVERFLQGRPPVIPLIDETREITGLEEAVGRMSQAAGEAGEDALVMSAQGWQGLVVPYLCANPPNLQGFIQEVTARLRRTEDLDRLNRIFALAMSIWNHTPQPERAGRSAVQLAEGERSSTTDQGKALG